MSIPNHSFALVAAAILICGTTTSIHAASATWKTNPTTNDWNTAANWTPETVPDESADVATFDVSNTTTVSVMTEFSLGSIVFNPGASAYTISINESNPTGFILISGTGVVNNSAATQNIKGVGGVGFAGQLQQGTTLSMLTKIWTTRSQVLSDLSIIVTPEVLPSSM